MWSSEARDTTCQVGVRNPRFPTQRNLSGIVSWNPQRKTASADFRCTCVWADAQALLPPAFRPRLSARGGGPSPGRVGDSTPRRAGHLPPRPLAGARVRPLLPEFRRSGGHRGRGFGSAPPGPGSREERPRRGASRWPPQGPQQLLQPWVGTPHSRRGNRGRRSLAVPCGWPCRRAG